MLKKQRKLLGNYGMLYYDIETVRPFIVSYDETNKIWLIKGSMRELKGGGVPYALITIDGKVLAIWHTR